MDLSGSGTRYPNMVYHFFGATGLLVVGVTSIEINVPDLPQKLPHFVYKRERSKMPPVAGNCSLWFHTNFRSHFCKKGVGHGITFFFSLQGVSILKPTIHGRSSHPLRSNRFPYIFCMFFHFPTCFFPANYGSGIHPYGYSPLIFLLIRIMAVIFHSCSSSLTCSILYIYHGYHTKL